MEGVIEVVISFTSWMISEKLVEYSWIYKDMVHISENLKKTLVKKSLPPLIAEEVKCFVWVYF